MREKLVGYSLDMANEVGGPKARGFKLILGITVGDVDYLEGAIQTGILTLRISGIRDNAPYGVNCVIDVPVRGRGGRRERAIDVRTVWELTGAGDAPRLVTAYLRP